MEEIVNKFKSFEESDEADLEYYQSLTPQQRLEILYELNRRWPTNEDAAPRRRLERVYRKVKLS